MDNSTLQGEISTALGSYRSKVLRWNNAMLENALRLLDIDRESEAKKDLDLVFEELWGQTPGGTGVHERVHKVVDFFDHIPDGTKPRPSPTEQAQMLSNLETTLNEEIEEEDRPITIPEDYKVLLSMTGGIIGPGFPLKQLTAIVTAVDWLFDDVLQPQELAEESGLLEEDGWELVIGWQCGSSEHEGGSYVVYGKCTEEEEYSELKWWYVCTHSFDNIEIYDSLVELLDGYPDSYKQMFEDEADGLVL